MILELVHATEIISRCKVSDSASLPRKGDFMHFADPGGDAKAYRIENVSWIVIKNQPIVKAMVFVSVIDPALIPLYSAPEN